MTAMTTPLKKIFLILIAVGTAVVLSQCKQPSAPEVDLNEPPSIVIGSHVDGVFVDGLITISGTTADDSGVTKVEVSVDGGGTYTDATGTGSWQIDFDTNSQVDGNLYIKAKATDGGGFTAYDFLTLIIDNAGPGVQIISPWDAQKLSGYVSIVGLATKAESVELSIDGGSYQPVTGHYTWYHIWNTTLETEGVHTIDVRPIRSGVPGTVESISVDVDQTVPSINFTAPAVGAYINGTVAITGVASDNNGVDRVEISTDGGLNYSDATGTGTWSYSLDTTTLADGARVVYARATDVTSLLGMASIPVTIDNNAPTVSVTSHTTGDLVSGVVNLVGIADDTVGLEKVEVKFGPVSYQPADGTNSWNYDFNTVSINNDFYDVIVRATDYAGNYIETTVNLIVDQSFPVVDTIEADTVTLTDGAYLNGTVALSGTVTDGEGPTDIATVEVKVDSDSYQGATYGAGSWSTLDTTAFPPGGSKTITVKVTDLVGGFTTLSRSVVFDNSLPSVAFSSPTNGGAVAGAVLIVGTAADSVSAIDTLTLEIDSVVQVPDPTLNAGFWSYSWDTEALPHTLGNHTLQITATDMAGNSQFSSITIEKTATAPSIVIGSHAGGDYVRGTIGLTGTSAPGTGSVSSVSIQVDSDPPVMATGTTAWTQDIDTTLLTEGQHMIYATVTNDSALTTTTQVTLTIDNTAPTVSIVDPTAANIGANALYGTVDIDGTASDVNLDYVEIDVDAGGYLTATGTTSFTRSWDTTALPLVAKDGVILIARAVDRAGNTATDTVTVDVHPHIGSLSKYSSFIGDTITIYGDNFATGSSITFDGVAATTKTFVSSQEYTVEIPTGATSGDVIVTTNGIASNGVQINIWSIETAPSGTSGVYPSLALDGNDSIYLGYIRGGGIKTVGFAKSTDGGVNWTEATSSYDVGSPYTRLDYNTGGGGAPIYTTVGLSDPDANGTADNVYMAYHHSKEGDLKIVKSTNGGTAFGAPVVVAANGLYPSLEVYRDAGQDIVTIAYYDSASADLVVATSIDSGSNWTFETIDSVGDVGSYASLDLDSGNDAHIAYYDATNRALKYAYWDSASLLWRIKTVDSSLAGEYASLGVAGDGSLHIAYYDGSSGDLDYATASSSIASFSTGDADAVGITGWYASLAVDGNNAPHAAYYDFSFAQMRYAEKTAGSWNTMTIPETAGISQSFTDIAIDSVNIQRIAYATGLGIRVARYLP